MHPGTVEIDIAGRVYSLVERTQGQHYTATLESDEGNVYTLHCHHGAWTCNCPDSAYRVPHNQCKHVYELRRRLETRLREQAETALAASPEPTPATPLPPEQQPGEQARRQYQEQLTMPATTETPTPDAVQTARGLNSLSKPAPQQVTPAPAQQSLSAVFSSQSGRTQLCIALAKAQSAVGRLAHDARNEFHKYDYTSSEAVIEAAKAALGGNGLAILPLEETLNGYEREGENRFELVCKFILLHQSGEAQPLLRHWPVCPDKGRPLDKATAAASTLCLCYLLRDLLLIPRVNPEDEVAARDDRQQQARPAKPQKSAKPEPPRNGAELNARLDTLDAWGVKKGLWAKGWLKGCILTDADANGFPADTSLWKPEQIQEAYEAARGVAQREKEKKETKPQAPTAPAKA